MPTGWESEKESLEAQLNTSIRVQIEKTRDGIRRLEEGQNEMGIVRGHLDQVVGLCETADKLIDNFPFIRQISRVHRNFVTTKRVYEELQALDEKSERTLQFLEADRKNPEDPSNLLVVFMHLSRMREFREQTLLLMKDAPQTAVFTLKRYFKRVDDVETAFEDFFWKLPRMLIYPLATEGKVEVIVKIAKVLSRMDRSLRSKLTTILDDVVTGKFEAAMNAFNSGRTGDMRRDPEGMLDVISFWKEDLALVRDRIAPAMPPDLQMFDWYVLVYHRHVHSVVSQCIAPAGGAKLGPADILGALKWVGEYHRVLLSEFGVGIDDVEPRLLGDREGALMIEYVAASRQKLNEWIGNLYEAEKERFLTRSNAPELDPYNHYYSPAAVDLIQIMRQHVTTAASSGESKLVSEIIAEIVKTVTAFQSNLGKLMNQESVKAAEKPDSVSPMFEDYVIMIGNTALRWATSLQQELTAGLDQLVDSQYLAPLTKDLKGLGDGFVAVAKVSTTILVEIIFTTIKPATSQLFGATWYSGEQKEAAVIMSQILTTFADYFGDWSQHADEFLFAKLVGDLQDRLLISYLESLRAKTIKLKIPNCQDLLKRDLQCIKVFFTTVRDEKKVNKTIEPIEKFLYMVTSSRKMIFLEFFSFWKVYPDISMTFLEDVLLRRDDLDKAAVKEIMETCRKKTLEEKIMETTPSIFSKLSANAK